METPYIILLGVLIAAVAYAVYEGIKVRRNLPPDYRK